MKKFLNYKSLLAFLTILGMYLQVSAQRGPGGVSRETTSPRDSNCKIWLDANSIEPTSPNPYTIKDWDEEYKSEGTLSAIDNSAYQNNNNLRPYFSSEDLGLGINNKPVFSFEDGRHFLLNSSNDINLNGPFTERTTFVVFRTSNDVANLQMIYEQGGNVRGLNIYIQGGYLYLGGYDDQVDGDGTPKWGYVYTREAVLPNTTYVVSHQYYGEEGNLSNGFIRGYLNGKKFTSDAINVGSIASHSGAPGIGAVNSNTVINDPDDDGEFLVISSSNPFSGRIAEFIAYDHLLNDAERKIVENYLGAKYFASIIENDLFTYEVGFGDEVIGVGRETVSQTHVISKGRNLFSIEVNPANLDQDNEYFLLGHNNQDADTWTSVNAPLINARRINREWRVSHAGDVGSITFTIDSDDLPAFPSPAFTRYVLIIDKANGLVSNFANNQTEVVELVNTSGTNYETTVEVPDGAFITLGIVEPTVNFSNTVGFDFESNIDKEVRFDLELNFTPGSSIDVAFTAATDVDALDPDDYTLTSTSPITFLAGMQTAELIFSLTGDLVSENSESILFTLESGSPTSAGLSIGTSNSLVFTIYDNDAPPKLEFQNLTSNVNENDANPQEIVVVRTGNTAGTCSVDYRLNTSGAAPVNGTATINVDYTFTAGTLSFADGESQQIINLNLLDNGINENNETVKLELYNVSPGTNLVEGRIIHTMTITDDDPEPIVEFTLSNLDNPESFSNPQITISLSSITDKDVSLNYSITGGTATGDGNDYNMAPTGTLNILAGNLTVNLPITIIDDSAFEPDETIEITITGATNATLTGATNLVHTYTITDYKIFEYTGSAGVGDDSDNVFWFRADQIAGNHNDQIGEFTDFSPNNNDGNAGGNSRARLYTTSNTINDLPVLYFDGVDDNYTLDDDNEINRQNYSQKYIFIAFRTSDNINSRQPIFFEGGGTRSVNCYIYNGRIYLVVYNDADDDGQGAWGIQNGNAVINVASAPGDLAINTNYFLALQFDVAQQKISLRLNGKEFALENAGIRNIYGHAVAKIGASSSPYYHDGNNGTAYFQGSIAEVIYYSNDILNDFRISLVENYLAAKYDIDFFDANDQFYAYESTPGHDMVGIGNDINGNSHKDAQGPAQVRIFNADDLNTGEHLLIAHDNDTLAEVLTDTPGDIVYRMGRSWRVAETGDVGNITLTMETDQFPVDDEDNLVFLVDDDGEFATGATEITTDISYAANVVTISNLNLNNGDVFTIGYRGNAWTGNVNNDWHEAGNWLEGIPGAGESAIIPSAPASGRFPTTISGSDVTISRLNIKSGASMEVPVNKSLTLTEALSVAGTLTLKSDASSTATLIDNGNITGTGTVQIERYFSENAYHYFTPPVSNAMASEFSFSGGHFYWYDETNADVNLMRGWRRPSGTLVVGRGLALHSVNNNVTHVFTSSPSELNTGNIGVTVSNSNYGIDSDGWNLIGNPYPSPVSAFDFVSANAGIIDGSLYFWDEDQDVNDQYESTDYMIWNAVGSLGGIGDEIPSHQAFYVFRSVTSPAASQVTFSNDMRVAGNPAFLRKKERGHDIEKIKLALIDDQQKYKVETLIAFKEDASDLHDPMYDAGRMSGGGVNFSVYSISKEQREMAIQTFSDQLPDDYNVQLGVNINKSGTFIITTESINMIRNLENVYLHDHLLDSMHRLSGEHAAYQFMAEKGTLKDRFSLVFNARLSRLIAGKVQDINGNPFSNIKVTIANDTATYSMTDQMGEYAINFIENNQAGLSVVGDNLNENKDGITTLDILLMRKHILQEALLDNPFQAKAADVNESGSISTLDIAMTRQVILGIRDRFLKNSLWRFYHTSTLSEQVSLDGLNDFSFTAVKLGDVNNSWHSTNGRLKAAHELRIAIEDKKLIKGSQVEIPVTAADFNQIAGYQFTLQWNPDHLRFIAIENEALPANFNQNLVEEGLLSTLWDNESTRGMDLPKDAQLFTLKFEVTGQEGQQTGLQVNSVITQSMAFSQDLEEVLLITKPARFTIAGECHELGLQVFPNPVTHNSIASFCMDHSGPVTLEIYDMTGILIHTRNDSRQDGLNTFELDKEELRLGTGIYIIKITTQDTILTKKIMVK